MMWVMCSAIGIVPMLLGIWLFGSLFDDCSKKKSEDWEYYG